MAPQGDTGTVSVTVTPVNDASVLAAPIPDTTAQEGEAFTYTFSNTAFSDVDAGDTFTYSATLAGGQPLPGWLRFDASTRTFSGTPDSNAQGTLSVRVAATDAAGATGSDTFAIAVADTPEPTLHTYPGLVIGSVQDWVDPALPDNILRTDAAIVRKDANGPTNPDFDQYGIYEFNVTAAAQNATSATLRVDPESGANFPNTLNVYAYAGDGAVTAGDADQGVLVGSATITDAMLAGQQYVSIPLNTTLINGLLAQPGEYLGIRLEVPDELGGPRANSVFFEAGSGLQGQLDLVW